jgi:integrase
MPRSPSVPSYRVHRPSGQAVVTLDGRDRYLGTYGSPESRSAYERLIATWLQNGRRLPEAKPVTNCTVGQLCDEFLTWAEGYYRLPDGTQSREVENVRIALRPLVQRFLDLPASEFGPKSLLLFRTALIEQGLSRKVVNQRVGIVRRAFRRAVQEERISPEILHGLQAVEGLKRGRSSARETDPVECVPQEHIERALPFLSEPVAAMVQLQLLTAARPGEVVILRPCDIDRSGDVWLYRPPAHKNAWRGHERIIALGPKAQELVRAFLRPGLQERPLFSPTLAEIRRRERARAARRTPLWPSHVAAQERKRKASPKRALRERYDVVTYARAIARACGRAGVPVWSPGRLRHNAATDIRRRYGLEAAMAMLGHRLVETTQLYSEMGSARAQEIARAIG